MKIFAHISWLYATLIIALSLGLMIVTFYLLPKPYSRKLAAWIIRLSTFFSTEVVGKEDPEAQIFLMNHQSDLDIVVMETISKEISHGLQRAFDIRFLVWHSGFQKISPWREKVKHH